MKPVINTKLVKARNTPRRTDTAYYIFDKDNILPYRVSIIHHRMKYGASNDPILGLERRQVSEYSKELISVHGPVIDIVDYFIAGATLDIPLQTMVELYDRIDKHLDAHIKSMREDPGYYIGDTFELFEQMVELCCTIFSRVDEVRKGNITSLTSDDPMTMLMKGRVSFMTMVTRDTPVTQNKEETSKEKNVSPMVDKLERMRIYYESSMSWRNNYGQ